MARAAQSRSILSSSTCCPTSEVKYSAMAACDRIATIIFYSRSRSGLLRVGDEARAALEGEVAPRPLHHHQQAIAKADEEQQMDEQPRHPRDEARDVDPAEVGDSGGASDGRE